jgi:hypothetical protein
VRCQAVRHPPRSADRHGAPQKTRRFDARGEAAVERNHNSRRPGSVGAADERNRQRTTSLIEEPVSATRSAVRKRRRQFTDRAGIRKFSWGWRDSRSGRIEVRQLHDGSAVRAQVRVGREIATPIAERSARTFLKPRRLRLRWRNRRPDRRNYASQIPRRTPSSQSHRDGCKYKRWQPANQTRMASVIPQPSD